MTTSSARSTAKPSPSGTTAVAAAVAHLHGLVRGELLAGDRAQLRRRRAVAGDEVVQVVGGVVAVPARVEHHHPAVHAPEGERRLQTGGSTAEDDDVVVVCNMVPPVRPNLFMHKYVTSC